MNAEARARADATYAALAERCGVSVEVGEAASLVEVGIGFPVVLAILDAMVARLAALESPEKG